MVGLDDIRVYITHLQNIVAQYIATCPIVDFCLAEDRKPGMRLASRWRDQTTLYILGIIAGYAAAEVGEGYSRGVIGGRVRGRLG